MSEDATGRGPEILRESEASLLELVDGLLEQGVVIDGQVLLGLADVDLIYLRLSLVLCAADRVMAPRGEGDDP